MRDGTVDLLRDPAFLKRCSKDVPIRRVFIQGEGGSGKTHFQVEVVLPIARHFFGEEGVKAISPTNATARLQHGSTMHSAAKFTRGQSLKAKKLRPNTKARRALEKEWYRTACLFIDEFGLSSSRLFAAVSRRAFFGRAKDWDFDSRRAELAAEHPFGDIPIQVATADMMQVNPVKAHSMVEAYSRSKVPGVPAKVSEEDKQGWKIFKEYFSDVVLFEGSHRFLDDELPALLQIMRTPGGAAVPEGLRQKILDRVQNGHTDPRIQVDYECEGQIGFFAFGGHAAIQWEVVMRMINLVVLQQARLSCGPSAWCNNDDGTPNIADGPKPGAPGQLVYPCFI